MATQIQTTAGEVVTACERTADSFEARMNRWQDDWATWYELSWWRRWFTKEPQPTWTTGEVLDFIRVCDILDEIGPDEEAKVFIDVNDARAIGMALDER